MRTWVLSLGMLFLLWGNPVQAKQLTPLEKALLALAQKNSVAAESTTACARTLAQTLIQNQSGTGWKKTQPGIMPAEKNPDPTLSDPFRLTATASAEEIVISWAGIAAIQTGLQAATGNTVDASANTIGSSCALPVGNLAPGSNPLAAQWGQPTGLGNTSAALVSFTSAAANTTPAQSLNILSPGLKNNKPVAASNTSTALDLFAEFWVTRLPTHDDGNSLVAFVQKNTSYRDASVTAQTAYAYQILAVDAKGQSLLASRLLKIGLLPSLPPQAPGSITVTAEEERVKLIWSRPLRTSHDIAGYLIFRAPLETGEWQCITKNMVKKEEGYDDSGQIDQGYQYQIRTVDSWGTTSTAGCIAQQGTARGRSRNGLILMSTAYRGLGKHDSGFNADAQFTYYIGTLYGDQAKDLSPTPLYLDPISLWLLSGDVKYSQIMEPQWPVSVALGAKATLLLFAGQQSATGGSFTFSQKSKFDYDWGTYLAVSHNFGYWGAHAGYLVGSAGEPIYYLSKYMTTDQTYKTTQLVYAGLDFPLVRRMNVALELLYPMTETFSAPHSPWLVNLHVDRLFNFDIAYLHWDQGWSLLGYFNLRFTLFPGK